MIKTETFETRWGFVAYSYEDYLKLKRLNVIFQKARVNAARWHRWARKDEHNRVQKKWLRNEKGQKTGFEIVGKLTEPVVCGLFSKKHRWDKNLYVTDNVIEVEYQKSRRPMASAEDVVFKSMSSVEIDELLNKAEIWWETSRNHQISTV